MSQPRNFYIDDRVFVGGKSNPFLNLASSKHLNDIMSQIILNTAPGLSQLPLVFNNAITDTYTSGLGTEIQWGGDLVKNTTVEGSNLYSVAFNKLAGFSVIAPTTGSIFIESQQGDLYLYGKKATTLAAPGALNIQTPQYATKPTGAILRLNQPASGRSEFTSYGLPATDGTPGQILVTNGAGVVSWTTATGTITGADNGLHINGVEVYLGGDLVEDTVISGDNAFDFTVADVPTLNLYGEVISMVADNIVDISSTNITTVKSNDTLNLLAPDLFTLSTPGVVANTLPIAGSLLQLQDNSTGEAEYTSYSLPLADGNPGNVLVTDGASNVTWQAPISEVLYFTDNPLNTSYPDDGAGGTTIESFNIPANTLTSNGSYLDVEFSVDVSGISGDMPIIQLEFNGLQVAGFESSVEHTHTQVIRSKIIRVSPTTYYVQTTSDFYNSSNVFLESKILTTSGTSNWSTILNLSVSFDLGVGNHTSELLHLLITKFLK